MLKDSEVVQREANACYERGKANRTPALHTAGVIYWCTGRILDALALVLKNQEARQ